LIEQSTEISWFPIKWILGVFKEDLVWLERTRIVIGNQFTKYFIEFVFVETSNLFGINLNVILMQQTCS